MHVHLGRGKFQYPLRAKSPFQAFWIKNRDGHRCFHKEIFAFETTLSGRGYAGLIPGWQADGYIIKLFFLRLASPELAIARVRQRVREGGHNIPEPIIRRRFAAGLRNLENLYKPAVDEWALYDNSVSEPALIEEGMKS